MEIVTVPNMPDPARLDRLVVLSPVGVNPPLSREESEVLEPARRLARSGVGVHLLGLGLRRFEVLRHLRSFVRTVEPNLVEERLVSLFGRPPRDLSGKASELLKKRCAGADVVQYEGPALFGFRAGNRPRVLVARRLESPAPPDDEREASAWTDADGVICLTERDRLDLTAAYGVREAVVIPVGVDTEFHRPATPEERDAARRRLGVEDRYVVLYTGGRPEPNRSALSLLTGMSRQTEEEVLWVVAGGAHPGREQGPRMVLTGPLRTIDPWFAAADCCVNPMVVGAGAEAKTSTFLARGLPVVTTAHGAGEIGLEEGRHALIREAELFAPAVERLRGEPELAAAIAAEGRALIERTRSWARIAERRREYLAAVAV